MKRKAPAFIFSFGGFGKIGHVLFGDPSKIASVFSLASLKKIPNMEYDQQKDRPLPAEQGASSRHSQLYQARVTGGF